MINPGELTMASSKNVKNDVSARIKANGKAGFVVMIPSREGTSGHDGQWVLRLPNLQALEAMSPDLAAFLTTMDPEEVVTLDYPDLTSEFDDKPVIGFRTGRLTNDEVVNFICPDGVPSSEKREWDLEFKEGSFVGKQREPEVEPQFNLISPSQEDAVEETSLKTIAPYVITGAVGVIAGVLAGLGLSRMKDSKSA